MGRRVGITHLSLTVGERLCQALGRPFKRQRQGLEHDAITVVYRIDNLIHVGAWASAELRWDRL